MKYNGVFSISYGEYCNANNIDEAPISMINKWRKDVVENYSKHSNSDLIMNLFGIPQENKKDIKCKRYVVKDEGYQLDKETKTLNVKMSLELK